MTIPEVTTTTLPSFSGDQSHHHRSSSPPLEKKVKAEKLCIDEMLQRHCGEFGKWQLKHFILTNLVWTLEAFHTMVMIFADRCPYWRCLNGAIGSACRDAAVNNWSVCELQPGSWEWVGGPGGTTVSEWGLVCSNKFKVGLVQALFFGGNMIGSGIFGHISDSFLGRKGSLIVACALNGIFGCITAFSPNYWTYVLLRFLTGFSCGGVGLCAFVLAIEPIGPKKRGFAGMGMSTFYFFSSGIAIISAIAYIFQKWRHLYIASSIPSILYAIIVLPFISESPRWYLIRGRVTEATKLMSTIASTNRKHLPDGVLLALDEEVARDGSSSDQINIKQSLVNKAPIVGSIMDVIRTPITRIRLFVTMAIYFLGCLAYYGLTLNVVNLKSNLYMNVALNSVAEMPAFAIIAMLLARLGRKPLTIGTMWLSRLFCLMGSLMRNVGVWKVLRMVCGILGIFWIAGNYNLMFIYMVELFPAVVRNAALGCTSLAAQMGAILAPIVVVLGERWPFVVFVGCGIVGGVFAYCLPETLNRPLYDTFTGLEAGRV